MVFVLPWDMTGQNHRLSMVRDEIVYQEIHLDFLFKVLYEMLWYLTSILMSFQMRTRERKSTFSLDFGENEGEYLLLLDRYGLFSMDPFLIGHLCAFRSPKKGSKTKIEIFGCNK